jgi:hypothetical protein
MVIEAFVAVDAEQDPELRVVNTRAKVVRL